MELFKQPGSKYWWADIRVDGQRIRKSTKQTTRAKASEVAADFIKQLQQGNSPTPRSRCLTLKQFAIVRFLPYIEAHSTLTENTKSYYRLGWQSLSTQPLSGLPLDAIRKPHIETIRVAGSNATHNRALRTLRRCLNVAHELDALAKVPKFSLVEEEGRSTLITPDTESRMAEQMAHTKRKSALQVGLYIILDCGLRPKEIAALAVEDINLEAGTIRVIRATTKSQSGVRLVPMTQRVKDLIGARLNGRVTGWLFPSPRYPGEHIQRQALTRTWKKHATNAGLPTDVNLYCARHTYGTDLMAATKNPFLTRKLMGHSDLSTTDRYQHPVLDSVGALMDTRNQTRNLAIVSAIGARKGEGRLP